MKFFSFLLISFFALSLIGCEPEPIDPPPPGPIVLRDTTIKDIPYVPITAKSLILDFLQIEILRTHN